MDDDSFIPNNREERLYEILLNYLESAEGGREPNPDDVASLHPEFASDLREYFETRAKVEGLAEPVRWVTQTVLETSAEFSVPAGITAAPPSRPCPLPTHRTIGDYELCEEIGRGGMCLVYRARDRRLNRFVAVKMVRGSRLSDEDARRRFYNEAETAAALEHPNIVPIYKVDEEGDQLFFSMKLLDGGSLKDRLQEFPTDPVRAARLVVEVARAVAFAHHRGVLHRDLKPSNVLLDKAGRPHVADFGLAKWLTGENDLTQTGALLGTPSYMAPEQASPSPRPRTGAGPGPGRGSHDCTTTAADIYGLGAVLYALLTGRPPFCGQTMHLTLEAVRHLAPAGPRSLNPRVDRDLETVCLKCLEKDPARRYATADDLADDLDRWLRHEPVLARRASPGRRLLALCRRYPASAALAAAAAVFAPALIATLTTAIVSIGFERDRALTQETLAKLRERDVTQQLYAADMALAHRDWLQGDVNSLKHLVDRWRPGPGREDFRDCAWRILAALQSADPLYPPEVEPTAQDSVYHVALSPDGQAMATAGKDGTVRIRRAGQAPIYLRGHQNEVNWVAFHPAGTRLATASDDGTARVWDAATGAELLKVTTQGKEVVAVEFMPDGKHLVIGGVDGLVRIYPLASGDAVRDLPAGHDRVCGLAIAPNGRYVAAGTKDGEIHVWDLESGSLRYKRPLAGQTQCVAYAPDGKTLAAGDIGGHVWLLDAATGESLRMFKCDNGCAVEGVAFSPDRSTLASCGVSGRVRLWDLRRGIFRRNLDCEDVRVWCVTFSHDGNYLLTGAADGAIRKWELSSAHAARFLPTAGNRGLCSMAFSPNSDTLALAGDDGRVTLWDPQTCRPKPEFGPIVSSGRGRRLVQFESVDNQLVVCGPDGALERWKLDGTSAPERSEGSGRAPSTLCCRPNTSEWLTCVAGAAPLVRDLSTTGQSMPAKLVGEPCSAAAWSPDGKLLAVAVPGRLRVLRDGVHEVTELALSGRPIACPAVAFSPDGKVLAAVDYGGLVRMWSTVGWAPRLPLEGRQISVRSIAFSPAGKVLAVGGDDGTVKIWQVATSQELFTLTTRVGGRVFAVAFAPDGCLAAACEKHDGTNDVALWPAPAP